MKLAFFFKLLIPVGVVAFVYLSACLYLFLQQSRFIFFPSPVIELTPAAFNLRYQEVWLPVANPLGKAERLHGWWIPASGQETGVLLYLHGNGINIGANAAHAARFHQMGFSVLLIDYRGYGLSGGRFPTESSVYQDAQTAWNYLIEEVEVLPEDIVIYGHSLGGAIAIDLAVKHPEAAGLIIESSFTSIRQMVDGMPHYQIFPADLLLHQRFDSLSKVKRLQMPVLFIHGAIDRVVPAQMSKILYAAAPEPKQLFLVADAGHNDVAAIAENKYFQAIEKFLKLIR